MIRRREFIALIGSVAAWPMAARGQQRPTPVIGVLQLGYPPSYGKADMASSRHAAEFTGPRLS